MERDFFSTDDWTFDLSGEKQEKPVLGMPANDLPWLQQNGAWEQYQNEMIYEIDSLVRQWIEALCQNKKWVRTIRLRRYTMRMIIEQIYGRPYDQSIDKKRTQPMSRVLAYYSSRIQRGGDIHGKHYSKTIYTISPKIFHQKPPYSLKLRLEWLAEKGEIPTVYNMRMPKDDLKPGHARNPKTDANMERRREEGRARYNELYKDRNH